MDEYRPRRSPAGERFIGMFSSPSPSSSPTEPSFVAGDELHEDDFLFSSPDAPPPQDGPMSPSRGLQQGHLGLLAALALHEGDRRLLVRGGGGGVAASAAADSAGTLLRRKATIAAAAASAASGSGSALSPTQSPTSTARAIPATARPKNAVPAPPYQYHQSAPVKVPVRRPTRKPAIGRWDEFDDDDDDDFQRGDAAMLPPHEMVARASAGGAGPAAPFSMLEGAGRTLKGRDLRRVRDAVLRQTGFLD
ncbi:protein S40-7-like [Phragmites australis]|uniref:protein S40-7-like n=1 Tax=Phragmites australis TaxID=29695 RepID=UPI002D7A3D9C|nr:protein S40-7-like [Phragmites australis]